MEDEKITLSETAKQVFRMKTSFLPELPTLHSDDFTQCVQIIEQVILGDNFRTKVKLIELLKPYTDKVIEESPELARAKIDTVLRKAAVLAAADHLEVPEDILRDLIGTEVIEVLKPAVKTTALRPITHVMPNNVLVNDMQNKGIINIGWKELHVLPQKEIDSYVTIDLEREGMKLIGPAALMSPFERVVSDAVMSLWVEAERQKVDPVITIQDIIRAMPGGGIRTTEQQEEAIERVLLKGRESHILLECTEEFRERGLIGKDDVYSIDDFYYNFGIEPALPPHSQKPVKGYRLHDMPPVLRYARMTGQVIEVPIRYLTICQVKNGQVTDNVVRMNPDRQGITNYMLRRIAVMKHDMDEAWDRYRRYERQRKKDPTLEVKPPEAFRKQSNVMLFESIFTGIDTSDRIQRKRYRDFVFDVLNYWKATGFITGYELQKKTQKITGISVILPAKWNRSSAK